MGLSSLDGSKNPAGLHFFPWTGKNPAGVKDERPFSVLF